MINPDLFGYAATSLNVIMLMPQVLKTWRTKHTKDLSFATPLIFLIACIFWIVYGVAKHAFPVIIANVFTGALNLVLIFFKLRYPGKAN